jgi:hypothetical protein
MPLKKAKTPRRRSNKKQGSKRRGSVKRKGGSSRSTLAKRSGSSSRRSIRGGGKVGKIAVGTGIVAIAGSYAAMFFKKKQIEKWYANWRKSDDINSQMQQYFKQNLPQCTNVISQMELDMTKLPSKMGKVEFDLFETVLKEHVRPDQLFISSPDAIETLCETIKANMEILCKASSANYKDEDEDEDVEVYLYVDVPSSSTISKLKYVLIFMYMVILFLQSTIKKSSSGSGSVTG